MAEVSILNNRVDGLAKEAALMGPDMLWVKSDSVMCSLQLAAVQQQLDILQMQKKDKEVQDLLSQHVIGVPNI